jgi:hypothetical protein
MTEKQLRKRFKDKLVKTWLGGNFRLVAEMISIVYCRGNRKLKRRHIEEVKEFMRSSY